MTKAKTLTPQNTKRVTFSPEATAPLSTITSVTYWRDQEKPEIVEHKGFEKRMDEIMARDPLDQYTHRALFEFHAPFWSPNERSR